MAGLRRCPDCDHGVSPRAMACPSCGRVLRRPPRRVGCCGGFLLIALAIGVALALTKGSRGPTPAGSGPPAATSPGRPGVGEEATLDLAGASFVYLCATDAQADWDELIDAENRADARWVGELMASGKVFRVPVGTRARVTQVAATSRKVRVLDGAESGREGWIQVEEVRPPAP